MMNGLHKHNEAKLIFWLTFLFALVTSVSICYLIGPYFGLSKSFGGEWHDGYIELARNLLKGNGFVFEPGGPPVIHRPPAYAFALIPVALLPESLQQLGVIVMNAFLLAGTAFLLFQMAQRFFGDAIAKTAVLIFILNPWILWTLKNPIYVIFQLFLYTLFNHLILHIFLQKRELPQKQRRKGGISLGITGGILILSHGTMLPIVFGVFVVLIFTGLLRKRKDWLQKGLVATILTVLIMAPWVQRNRVVYEGTGSFVPVTGSAGWVYFAGNSHWGIGDEAIKNKLTREEKLKEHIFDQILRYAEIDRPHEEVVHIWGFKDPKMDAMLNKKFIQHVKDHPFLFAKKFLLNAATFYFPVMHSVFLPESHPLSDESFLNRVFLGSRIDTLFISLFYFSLWSFTLIGLVQAWKKDHPDKSSLVYPLGAIFLYAVPYFPFSVFVGHSHYTFGTHPFLSTLAAYGIFVLVKSSDRLKTKERFA